MTIMRRLTAAQARLNWSLTSRGRGTTAQHGFVTSSDHWDAQTRQQPQRLWQRYDLSLHAGQLRSFSSESASVYNDSMTTTAENTSQNEGSGSEKGLYRLLNDEERSILRAQQDLTAAVRRLAAPQQQHPSEDPELSPLDHSAFCVVLAGEFNAGKSTVLNALLGEPLLETGSLPTTDRITILSHTSAATDRSENISSNNNVSNETSVTASVKHYYHDLSLLQDLTLVDTPGTNAVWRDHTETTMRLLPKADLILFCTSADRPFPESERQLLESLHEQYRKPVVLIVTKMDVLDASGGHYGAAEKQRVVDFVTQHAGDLLGMVRPVVIPLSAKHAMAAKGVRSSSRNIEDDNSDNEQHQSAAYQRSNFGALESFLRESLTTSTKIKSKLSNPIGLAEGTLQKCRQDLEEQRQHLKADVATLQLIESQWKAWRAQLEAELQRADSRIQTYLEQQLGNRAAVLQRRVGLLDWMVWSVLKPERLERAWRATEPPAQQRTTREQRRKHSSNISQENQSPAQQLDIILKETAESLATQGRAQGQALIEYLGHRPSMASSSSLSAAASAPRHPTTTTTSLVGSVTAASRFEDTRQWLEEHFAQATQRHIAEPDEDNSIPEQALLSTWRHLAHAAVGVPAVVLSVGGGWWALAATADPAASTLGGALLMTAVAVATPSLLGTQGRRSAAQRYETAWQTRSEHLREDVAAIGAQELERIHHRIQEGVAPYTRFVEAEQDRLDQMERECQEASLQAQQLRNRINKL